MTDRCSKIGFKRAHWRQALLAGASAISLCAAHPALAGDILRGNPMAAPTIAIDNATANSQAAAAAAARAQNSLLRATQAVQNLQAAQSAARALVLNAASSVPNGLTTGGLEVVANPVMAADDTTGTNTWQGANAPTQTADSSGNVRVGIKQTASRAILSWKSYNVGSKTTLTYDQQGNKDWIALNRVVGDQVAPSQILGSIKSDGTVLVINQNGIIFGGSAQINTNSLIASSLEVGRAWDSPSTGGTIARTIAQRNQEFLDVGLLGYGSQTSGVTQGLITLFNGNPVKNSAGNATVQGTGKVEVQAGAQITSGDGGYILLTAPNVTNSGALSATDGQVILAAGDALNVAITTGAADSTDPGIRGLLAFSGANLLSAPQVINTATGLIQSARGSILLSSAGTNGATVNQGGLFATTSVSRNGAIEISGNNIEIAPNSVLAISPDNSGGTIPQDSTSLADFKRSQIIVGDLSNRLNTSPSYAALIDIGANALLYAPSGDITVGMPSGANSLGSGTVKSPSNPSRVFIDTGATIDVSGLKDVLIPDSRNSITISPLKGNELADSVMYKNSFLNGASVTVDPRLSGVRDDGVAWIGSPLIDARTYKEQVGITASELMTTGGNVTLGAKSYTGSDLLTAPNIIVKAGATIDISGGWVTYQGGTVTTTQLLTSDGRVVNIGKANLTDTYVGIYNGTTVDHASWGVSETYGSLFQTGSYVVPTYNEGRDAGSLTIKASSAVLDGSVYGQAFAGPQQSLAGQQGSGTSTIYGDLRMVQAASSQMPTGGFLSIQALSIDTATLANAGAVAPYLGGGDIVVQSAQDYTALALDLSYGQTVNVADDGTVTIPTRDPGSYLSTDRISTITLSDAALSGSGFSQISLHTSGAVTVATKANVSLAAGGVFDVLAGRAITINGTVSVPSGTISIQTFGNGGAPGGSVFSSTPATVGAFDIIVNGTLSTRGLWVNNYGLADSDLQAKAWSNGGSITLYAAPQISDKTSTNGTATPATVTDRSGSIYINSGALVDVSSGGYVGQYGALDLSARGGNLSLYDETAYFQTANGQSGFRVKGLIQTGSSGDSTAYQTVNPDQINARVVIDPSAIRAQGFAGGGTFTLATPEFAFGSDRSGSATQLPLDFFSSAGFANYKITSYKTDLIANPFTNGLGGTDAILATQTLTIGAGQNLALTQSMLPSVLSAEQADALRGLASGGDLFSVLTPSVPVHAWDAKPINLTLGGLLELDVAPGGSITGAAGASLTVSKLLNEGTIRLPGGTITQQEVLPSLYDGYVASGNVTLTPLGIRALSDIFSVNADGTIDENAKSVYSASLTNAQLAGSGNVNTPYAIYVLGKLDANQGIVLAQGSVTDLSGTSIRNPYAFNALTGASITSGRMVAGGSLITDPRVALSGQSLFNGQKGAFYNTVRGGSVAVDMTQTGRDLIINPGATLDLSGAVDTYALPSAGGTQSLSASLVPTAQWSAAGTLSAGAGFTLTGATLRAAGGAPEAAGGTLSLFAPVLTQHDSATPVSGTISADMIANSGFDSLVAVGSVSSSGDVSLHLDRGFFLQTRNPTPQETRGLHAASITPSDALLPTIKAGGRLEIDAPYIALTSNLSAIANPAQGTSGNGSVVFNAGQIDITGAVLFDQSVASVTMNASGDVRLIGAQAWQNTYGVAGTATYYTLTGVLAVNGDLTINAGQIYPTTGSSFIVSSAKKGGTITFGRSGTTTPAAPYSAGGNLTVEAANIVQGGVLRVPLGTLTLGTSLDSVLAPATQSVVLASGGITSVSANGLIIPYGTTTDQIEWYFTPTGADPLTAPPSKLLSLVGTNVEIRSGATVDLSGGGDVTAYEFVPGTGGTRDVLDRYNPDIFTGNNGYQYADHRQVYAIVPGLSDAPAAAYDPVYSSDYAALSSVTGVGSRVYLTGGNGLAAGWYTLLPAKYALLPGGMRVVEETGAANVVPGVNQKLTDGTLKVSGYYGDALSGSRSSTQRLFTVQSQAVITKESKIVQTTGNSYFTALAQHNGTVTPQLAQDAGRLVINPGASLIVDAVLSTAAANGGRGAQVDIGGSNIAILASLPTNAPQDGMLRITATSLTNLKADSLLIGGTRSDNADGTTSLNVTAQTVLLQNESSTPLSAGEVVLAATQKVSVADGSVITATGTLSDTRTGAYRIGEGTGRSGTGALLRVANGPERLVTRSNITGGASLVAGAATLTGTAVMFDSSGTNALDQNLIIKNAKYVAIGAPRIGFGADPASYNGLVLTGALESLLTQSGAQLTLRSQSSIDFAGGTYNFGNIRFDAGALSGLDSKDVTVNGSTVSLGNAGSNGSVCTTCSAGTGALALNADTILFTGGIVASKASTLATAVSVTLAHDTTITLPAGTKFVDTATTATDMVLPAGTVITLAAGTGLVSPNGVNGDLAAGSIVAPATMTYALASGSSITLPNGYTYIAGNGAPFSNGPGNYTLGQNLSLTLPAGTQTVLGAADHVTLTQFFGSVTLSAKKGVFAVGADGVLDTGAAPLTLHTPYIGDNGTFAASASVIPGLTLASSGAVVIDNAGAAALPTITAVPGASLTIDGASVSISGTKINATAGTLDIESGTGISLSNGAIVQTPGYTKTYGDAADPVTQDAPGGQLVLNAKSGDITLGAGTLVSVGGGMGKAGTLELLAQNGSIAFGGTIDGKAPNGGGSLTVDTKGAFDLATLGAAANTAGFTGTLDIHTHTGDLGLLQGQGLTAGSVKLTADGGLLTIAGNINTSGTNGGNVDLYGASGVTLADSAVIDAHAIGYAADDTRQAAAGNVTLGTIGAGALSVANGAKINVGVARSGDRLVPYYANTVKYYNYVEADKAGTVTLRAPVIEQAGPDTMNVSVASASSIVGAGKIVLEGVKSWDLRALSAIANSGVTLDAATNTVTIDPRGNYFSTIATADGLVPFIQNLDLSGAYANLGGLASSSVFHVTPGVVLAFDGNIKMDRNWNLAAGTVNVSAATTAGLMRSETFKGVGGSSVTYSYVVPGSDAALFAKYVTMLYRTGGSVYGEAPDIALQAAGNLTLNASINDGFFQFRDQTNADYLAAIIPTSTTTLSIQSGYWSSSNSLISAFTKDGTFITTAIGVASTTTSANKTPQSITVPYSATGNSVSPDKSGDPFGSAALFPLLPGNVVASSANLELVTGADLARAAGLTGSADPLALNRTTTATLSLGGSYTYSYGGSSISVVYGNDLSKQINFGPAGPFSFSANWLSDVLGRSATVDSRITGGVSLYYGTAGGKAVLIGSGADAKKLDQPGDLIFLDLNFDASQSYGSVKPKGSLSSLALRDIAKISDPSNPQYDAYLHNLYVSNATTPTASGDFFTVASTSTNPYAGNVQAYVVASLKTTQYILQKYVDPLFTGSSGVSTATVTPLVRTGVGSIAVAASGNVNLQTSAATQNNNQVGGAAIYTAGHPADTSLRQLADPQTGALITIDPSSYLKTGTNFTTKMAYDYGNLSFGETNTTGTVGILVADPVYAEGGGDVSVTAGGDVLGRRDLSLQPNSVNTSWTGSSDEPWRSGQVATNTYAQIDPQAYRSGIGALGGGNITVKAGGNLVDLTVTATDSLATAKASGGATATRALMTFGRGNVSLTAGNNIMGGQVDVASGTGRISAGGNIRSAGTIALSGTFIANLLRLHLTDAMIAVTASGSAALQGVSALGPQSSNYLSNLNADTLYSAHAGLSVTANGSVSLANQNDALLAPANSASTTVSRLTNGEPQLVYPGTLELASLNGDLTIGGTGGITSLLLMPSATGQLQLLAGGSIAPASIAMLDADVGLLPGVFSIYDGTNMLGGGVLAFPTVLPNTRDGDKALQHKPSATHAEDSQPVRIYAGGDIGSSSAGLTLSLPKQARVQAGRDIINMMYFGQNLSASDITRITAGRDITATTKNVTPIIGVIKTSTSTTRSYGAAEPALQGNTFVIGGPGSFMLEAGRDLGPFLNSATATIYAGDAKVGTLTFGGGVLSVGNEWNPYLPEQGASLMVLFGVAKGLNYDGLREAYLDPANLSTMPDYLFEQVKDTSNAGGVTVIGTVADRSKPIYAPRLIQWMQQNAAAMLLARYGTTGVSYDQAYAAFATLPALAQRGFLNQVYFNELKETSNPFGPSDHQYARGYQAVNTLFPASYGYTANNLAGGDNGANNPVITGNLDLRLATIETARGGDISILGPGGRVLAGSTIATAQQAAHRNYDGARLYSGILSSGITYSPAAISSIPSGEEGILTLRGGDISTFTDGDFLLNQSRLFTEQGGDIIMWSSNADLNAGQGPKTSANFPPVQVRVDANAYAELDQAGATTGAGIAALRATPDSPASNVYLIAPRGTVDFGDAGVRVSGSIFVAAAHIANADNLQVSGNSYGIPVAPVVDTAGLAAATNAAAASAQDAAPPRAPSNATDLPSIITVEVLGYGGEDAEDDPRKRRRKP